MEYVRVLDHENDVLTIELSQEVNPVWIRAFKGIHNPKYVPGIHPTSVRFKGNTAAMKNVRIDVASKVVEKWTPLFGH